MLVLKKKENIYEYGNISGAANRKFEKWSRANFNKKVKFWFNFFVEILINDGQVGKIL